MAGLLRFDEVILAAIDRLRPRAVLALGIEHAFAPRLRSFCTDIAARSILVERGAAVRWLGERGGQADIVLIDDAGSVAVEQTLLLAARPAPALILRHGGGGALAPEPGYTFRTIEAFAGLGALAAAGTPADTVIDGLFACYDNTLVRRLEAERRELHLKLLELEAKGHA